MSQRIEVETAVKEILSHIFDKIKAVITSYEGFVENFAGDAVMAIFGIPRTHADYPVRAIKAAREIHDRVAEMNPVLAEKIGRPLSMYTGINTGLVVTGEISLKEATLGVLGDTVNVASRPTKNINELRGRCLPLDLRM